MENLQCGSTQESCLPYGPPSSWCGGPEQLRLTGLCFATPAALKVILHSFPYHPKDCPGITQLSAFHGYQFETLLGPPWIASTPHLSGADAHFLLFHPSNLICVLLPKIPYLKISGPLLSPLLIFKQNYMLSANSLGTWGKEKAVAVFGSLL